MNRRRFIGKSAGAAALLSFPTILPRTVFGKNAPSNRVTVGMIGTGRQGFGNNLQGADLKTIGARIPGLLELPDVQVVAVSDVDGWRMEKAKALVDEAYAQKTPGGKYQGCSAHTDFREILARKDIDAVMISTPDHWHVPMAILAARAGKHIACEKPLSMSVHQGRELVRELQKHPVVNRTDSEFRSVRPQNHAVELVRNGRIGKLLKIEVSFPSDPEPVGVQPDMPVPSDLHYDLWLGPAQEVPYTEMRVHSPLDLKKRPNWMRVDTYAQGMIANWGTHYFDMAQWANDSEYSGPVEVEGSGFFPKSLWNTMINFKVKYRYANGVELSCLQAPDSKPGIKYTGSEGWISVEGFPGIITASNPALLTSRPAAGEIDFSGILWDKPDFIEAVKTGRKTLEPLEVGHRTVSIAQIGLIACQVGEPLKWDPEKEAFTGNNAANALLAAPVPRKEWTL